MAKKRENSKTPIFGNKKIFRAELWKFYMSSLEDMAKAGLSDKSVSLNIFIKK